MDVNKKGRVGEKKEGGRDKEKNMNYNVIA